MKSWKLWLSIALLATLVVLIERGYGWGAVLASWQTIPLPQLLAAVALMLASYLLRALRFYDFFNHYCRGHWWQLTRITVVHNFLNNLLPMRTGEASFPILMKSHFQCPISESAPALLWLRLMDLYVLLALALWTLGPLLGPTTGLDERWLWPLQTLLLALPMLVLPLQNALLGWLQQHPGAVVRKLAGLLGSLPSRPWPFVRALFWTLINWLVKLLVYTWLLQTLMGIPFHQAWIGASTGELSSVLPIHGVAGAGTYEAGVVAGLALWDVDPFTALPAAVNLHLFVLGCTLLLTALLVLLIRSPRTSQTTRDTDNI